MSNSSVAAAKVTSHKKPIIKLNAQSAIPGDSELLSNLGLIRPILIYETSDVKDPILNGQYKQLSLKNYYNTVHESSRTVALTVTLNGVCITRNSDRVTKIVGQRNYDLIFHAISSVLSNEAKVKAMLALLTVPTHAMDASTQTEGYCGRVVKTLDSASQTDVWTPLSVLKPKKSNPRYRKVGPHVISTKDLDNNNKRIVSPYIKETPKANETNTSLPKVQKIVINPADFKVFLNSDNKLLPDLGNLNRDLDEDCNSNMSDMSLKTVDSNILRVAESLINCTENRTAQNGMSSDEEETDNEKTENEKTKNEKTENEKSKIVANIEDIFNFCEYELYDGSKVKLPAKPEDVFHVATKDNLAYLSPEEKQRLVMHQAYMDFKLCLDPNENGYLPIHLAVMYNDLDLVTRQCLVLPTRGSNVDVFPLNDNLSSLHLAILKEVSVGIIEKLLEFKADPLDTQEEQKNAFHRAAEASKPVYLKTLFRYVAKRPRDLMQANDVWTSEMTTWSEARLLMHLYQYISETADLEGYTPLMLASKLGRHRNAQVLLNKCSSTVNLGMKTSGNSALFLAVEAVGTEAIERGHKAKLSEDHLKTIEILLKYHADPLIENFSSTSSSDLLGEFNINHLSMFIAQKLCAVRDIPQTTKIDEFMVMMKDAKNNEGNMICMPINGDDMTNTKNLEKKEVKPVILQNTNDLLNKEANSVIQNTKDLGKKEATPVILHSTSDLEKIEAKPVILQNKKDVEKKEAKPVILQNAKGVEKKEAKPFILQNTKGVEKKEAKPFILQNTKGVEKKEAKPFILQNTKGVEKKEAKPFILQNTKGVEKKEAKPVILLNTKHVDKNEAKPVVLLNTKDVDKNEAKPVILLNTKGVEKKEAKPFILQDTKDLERKEAISVVFQNTKNVAMTGAKPFVIRSEPFLRNMKDVKKIESKPITLHNNKKDVEKRNDAHSKPVILQNILINAGKSPIKSRQTFLDNKSHSNSFNISINIPPTRQENTSMADAKTSLKRKSAEIEILNDKKIKINVLHKKT